MAMSLSKGITLGAKYRSWSVFGNWEKAIEISECIAHRHLASIQKVFNECFTPAKDLYRLQDGVWSWGGGEESEGAGGEDGQVEPLIF